MFESVFVRTIHSPFACPPKINLLKKKERALAGVAQWTEYQPVNQRFIGWILSQGTCLGQVPSLGRSRGNHTIMSPSLYSSLPLTLKITKNKIFFKKERKKR